MYSSQNSNEIMDPIFMSAFAAESDGLAEGEKTSWPDYPDEKPKKVDLILWLEHWKESLIGSGYGALLRHELPYQLAQLAPRLLLDVPVSVDPAKKLRRTLASSTPTT
jgi:hypothetical protein